MSDFRTGETTVTERRLMPELTIGDHVTIVACFGVSTEASAAVVGRTGTIRDVDHEHHQPFLVETDEPYEIPGHRTGITLERWYADELELIRDATGTEA